MATVIEDRYFIFVDGNNNNNKFYRYQLQDDGSIITTWGRVGQKASSGMKSGGKPALERLIRERTSRRRATSRRRSQSRRQRQLPERASRRHASRRSPPPRSPPMAPQRADPSLRSSSAS